MEPWIDYLFDAFSLNYKNFWNDYLMDENSHELMLSMWYSALKNYPERLIKKAALKVISESIYPPTIAQFLAVIRPMHTQEKMDRQTQQSLIIEEPYINKILALTNAQMYLNKMRVILGVKEKDYSKETI